MDVSVLLAPGAPGLLGRSTEKERGLFKARPRAEPGSWRALVSARAFLVAPSSAPAPHSPPRGQVATRQVSPSLCRNWKSTVPSAALSAAVTELWPAQAQGLWVC